MYFSPFCLACCYTQFCRLRTLHCVLHVFRVCESRTHAYQWPLRYCIRMVKCWLVGSCLAASPLMPQRLWNPSRWPLIAHSKAGSLCLHYQNFPLLRPLTYHLVVTNYWNFFLQTWSTNSLSRPYSSINYIGICRPEGYGFWAILFLNRVWFSSEPRKRRKRRICLFINSKWIIEKVVLVVNRFICMTSRFYSIAKAK